MYREDREYVENIDQFDAINIEALDYPVEIRKVEGKQVKVLFTGLSDIDEINSEVTDRTFVIEHRMQHCLRLFLGLVHFRRRLIIEVPSEYHGSIHIRTCNGSIKTYGVLECSKLRLFTVNGSVHVYGAKCELVDLSSKNGSIHIEQVIADQMSFETRNGSITGLIMGRISDYNICSNTVNGSNNLPERMQIEDSSKSLYAKTSNGKIRMEFVNP